MERDPQQTTECVYSIPCESDRWCNCETARPQDVRLCEHRHNPRECLIGYSKLA
jgi:hypothetical protein